MSRQRQMSVAARGGVLAMVGVIVAILLHGAAVLLVDGFAGASAVRLALPIGLGIVLATAFAWLAGRTLTKGIEEVRRSIQAAGSPTQDLDLPVRSPDATGELVRRVELFRERLLEALQRHRRARVRAERTDRYETEFLTTVSHELRTPLNSILGFTQVLLDEIDGPLTPGQREDVHAIQASGEHLKGLVDDVLDLAAMQSGRFDLKRRRVDIEISLLEVARLLEGQLRDRPIVIDVRVQDGLPRVSVDPKRLRQILTNLGTNAVKFTEEGTIRLEAEEAEGEIRLSVRDTGPGIAPEELDTIFGEFTQLADSNKRWKGSGLGLAITKRLTELHGGRVTVESVVGQGSAFHIHLPLGPAKGQESDDA